MAYTTNPQLPRVRMEAVKLVRQGWGIRKVARHFGFNHSTIIRWVKRAPADGRKVIPTKSSRPKSHPRTLAPELQQAIVKQRMKNKRCAEVVQQELKNQGVLVSLSSVKRTLKRTGLLKTRSPWKRRHDPLPRPMVEKAGDLIQMDTIHIFDHFGKKLYIYTLIDLHSRWAYAKTVSRINTHQSLKFIKEAMQKAPFLFQMVQTDNGSEFSTYFTEHVRKQKLAHRHTRVRQSNDNAHIERFNRTIQEECLDKIYPSIPEYRKAIRKYLPYYNNERLHLSLNLLTPIQVVPSY